MLFRSGLGKIILTMGTFVMGVGMTGFITSIRNKNFEGNIISRLNSHSSSHITTIEERIADITGQSENDLIIPDSYSNIIYKYHQTIAKIDGKITQKWIETPIDFSKSLGRRRKVTTFCSVNPTNDTSMHEYTIELINKRGKFILLHTNNTSQEEVTSVSVFEKIGLNDAAFGVHMHMDWTSSRRLSMTILSCSKLATLKNNEGELDDEKATAFWKENFLPHISNCIPSTEKTLYT